MKKEISTVLPVLWLIFLGGILSAQDLTVSPLFSDGAVLQRDRDIPIWGTTKPGSEVEVTFKKFSKKTTADEDGKWKLVLPAQPLDKEPSEIKISSGDETIVVEDLLIGDVWLCSGQSNMAMRVTSAKDAEKEIESSDFPELREFTVGRKASQTPLTSYSGFWEKSSPDTTGNFSATAFFFGREIHREIGVPVGLIVSAWSGSAIEAWTSREVQEETKILKTLLESWKQKTDAYTSEIETEEAAEYQTAFTDWQKEAALARKEGKDIPQRPKRPINPGLHHHHPAVLFNGMLNPLIPYSIKGAIWYQGETNGLTAESAALYETQLPLMVNDWRKRWGYDFPTAWVQLPFISANRVDWPTIREAMRKANESLPNTGMAVTLDLGEERLLHPKNKQAFAHRLALWARSEVYGQDIPFSGPLAEGFKKSENEIVVSFSHAEEGLKAKGESDLSGFEIRAARSPWYPADAKIEGNYIHLSSDRVKNPSGVRYAWANHPAEANLYNSADLPASPFLLGDNSPVVEKKKSQTPPPTKPPLQPVDISTLPEGCERLDIFLLMGQSNMKGRGVMPAVPLSNPKIVMMHKPTDKWFLARHPLHLVGDPATFEGHDNAGVGPGLSFAETLLKHRPNTRIALIPCAVGGTRIGLWERDAKLYVEAVRKAKLAVEAGPKGKTRLAGALWLQGEADSKTERVGSYSDSLDNMIKHLREDLNSPELPFLVTTILELRSDIELRKEINKILVDLPNRVPNTAAADARDLSGHIGDMVHLDTATQNEIGRRFARKYLQLPVVRKSVPSTVE